MKPEPKAAKQIVGGFFPRLLESLRVRSAIRDAVAAEAEAIKTTCPGCQTILRVDVEETARLRVDGEGGTIHHPCAECERRDWLRSRGVPEAYAGASFANWRVETSQDGIAADKCRAFARRPSGVLVVAGAMGRGKTHLATAIFREARNGRGIWTDQPAALAALRAEYGSGNPASLAIRLGNAALLVWDDLGMATGAKDEGALVESVFYRRHANRLPSVITTNLAARDFAEAVGARLSERLRENLFAWVTLSGASRRTFATPKTGA